MRIKTKRVYEAPAKEDGTRFLVDRLWPRGLSKTEARVDQWLKDVAPSNELRRWFAHDPARWTEFRRRYLAELKGKAESVALIKEAAKKGSVTLLYGARDTKHNNAVVLRELIILFKPKIIPKV
jgi:uncharacterized protein YeaO (DUF488 family)